MKRLLYAFIYFILFIGNNSISAQNQESVVVISEENLTSLIQKLSTYKNAKKNTAFPSKNINFSTRTLDTIFIPTTNLVSTSIKSKSLPTQQVPTKNSQTLLKSSENEDAIKSIQDQLAEIRYSIAQLSNKTNTESVDLAPTSSPYQYVTPTTQYIYPIREREIIVKNNTLPIITTIEKDNSEILKLQTRLDSLQYKMNATKSVSIFKNAPITSLETDYNEEILVLQSQINSMQLALNIKNSAINSYEILVEKFKEYKQTVFFANNATSIGSNGQRIVDEIFILLTKNNNLDVVLNGFSSNKGNSKYNEKLSMQRTEAIKKALVLKGLPPTRVLTQYHGIDYNAISEDAARRVELSFIIRK